MPAWQWDAAGLYAYGTLLLLTGVSAVASNAAYLALVAAFKPLRAHSSAFSVNLALCDLLVGLLWAPVAAVGSLQEAAADCPSAWPNASAGDAASEPNGALCQAQAFTFQLLQVACVLSLTWISAARFVEIRFSLRWAGQGLSGGRGARVVAGVWAYAVLTACLPFVGVGGYGPAAGGSLRGSCGPVFGATRPALHCALVLGAGVVLPMLALCGMYAYIVHAARRQAKKGTFICNDEHCYYVPANRYIKCTIPLITAVVTMLVCWSPYVAVGFYSALGGLPVPPAAQAMATWLLVFTSVLNPWTHSLRQKKFQNALRSGWEKARRILMGSPGPGPGGTGDRNQGSLENQAPSGKDPQLRAPGDGEEAANPGAPHDLSSLPA